MTKNKRYLKITLITLGILCCAAVVAILIINNTKISQLKQGSDIPTFSFNAEYPGWWASENSNAQATVDSNYAGATPVEKLPVADMRVFRGQKNDMKTDCFIMASYYNFKTDLTKLQQAKQQQNGEVYFQKIGESAATILTVDGQKLYTLTNYEISGPGTEDSMKGVSYGWIELNNGYIEMSGVCPTSSELSGITGAINALSLTKK